MNVKEVLKLRDAGVDTASSNIYHLWGIYEDPKHCPAVVGLRQRDNFPRYFEAKGRTGAYPVALLYRGLAGQWATFHLIPQYKLITGVWVHFPDALQPDELSRCPMKLYRRLRMGNKSDSEKLMSRFYYCYQTRTIKPLKPEDWINRKLIDIAEKEATCPT